MDEKNCVTLPEVLSDLLLSLTAKEAQAKDALSLFVAVKRAEAALDVKRQQLLLEANTQFQALEQRNPNLKQWPTLDQVATLQRFSPRAVWQYPSRVIELQEQLAQAQKAAQSDGTATKLDTKLNLATHCLFSVKLLENFK